MVERIRPSTKCSRNLYCDLQSQKSIQILDVARVMRSFRRILPDGFLGTDDMNATFRILLYGATYTIQKNKNKQFNFLI